MPFKEALAAIELQSFLQKHWEQRRTLFILLILTFIGGITLAYNFELSHAQEAIAWEEIALIVFVMVCLTVVWHVSRKPTKTEKGKFGIVIAIKCEAQKENQRLKLDFINALGDVIRRGNHQNFHVFELSEYHSGKITSAGDAARYLTITNANLILYGDCRIRSHQGQPTYVLSIRESVRHALIPVEISQRLGQDMGSIFPQQALIPESHEVVGFMVARDLVGLAARYTLGYACLLSQDTATAFDLHHNLWLELKPLVETDANLLPSHKVMLNRLPALIIEEGLLLTKDLYIDKPHSYLEQMKRHLDVVQEMEPGNYHAHLIRAIYHFLNSRDINKAEQSIKNAENERDSAWQYSAAFLAAYKGDLEKAHKIYKRAFKGLVNPEVPLDVEIFIREVLTEEPDKIQLWYCLGMVNYFYKNDLLVARSDFSRFLGLATRTGKFSTSVEFAQKYLQEINDA
jgi:hypothetical protein